MSQANGINWEGEANAGWSWLKLSQSLRLTININLVTLTDDLLCAKPKYCICIYSFNPENNTVGFSSVQFGSVTQSCLTLCNPMDCSTPGFPVHHQLPEPTQTHVQWVGDAIQPSHPLLSPSPPTFNLSQHQGLFKWVSSSHQVAKVLEFQLQHQSFQWLFSTDFL